MFRTRVRSFVRYVPENPKSKCIRRIWNLNEKPNQSTNSRCPAQQVGNLNLLKISSLNYHHHRHIDNVIKHRVVIETNGFFCCSKHKWLVSLSLSFIHSMNEFEFQIQMQMQVKKWPIKCNLRIGSLVEWMNEWMNSVCLCVVLCVENMKHVHVKKMCDIDDFWKWKNITIAHLLSCSASFFFVQFCF